jgi:hypothetical protein
MGRVEVMRRPLVSVIIPCYNAEKTLKNTVFSVLIDPYQQTEILIVDDGSTDGSAQLIRQLCLKDRRIRGFHQQNLGVSAARNHGARKARGQYLAFLDADDLVLRNAIFERMKLLLSQDTPRLLGAFCPATLLDIDRVPLTPTPMFDYPLPDNRLFFGYMPESVFNPACAIVKRSAFEAVQGFDETLVNGSEDYDIWHRMMRTGGYFQKTNACAIGWTQHAESRVHSKIASHYKECKEVLHRIYGPTDTDCAPELKGGFASAHLEFVITRRAFTAAYGAAISGHADAAKEIIADISSYSLDLLSAHQLEQMMVAKALRALCRREEDWPRVWPLVKEQTLQFVKDLYESVGGGQNTLEKLFVLLQQMEARFAHNVVVAPKFDSLEHFADFYYRLIWALYPVRDEIDNICLPTPSVSFFGRPPCRISELLEFELPEHLDEQIASMEEAFVGKIQVFPQQHEEHWITFAEDADLVIRSSADQTPSLSGDVEKALEKAASRGRQFIIAPSEAPFDSPSALEIINYCNRYAERDLVEHRNTFNSLVEELGQRSPVYLIGAGDTSAVQNEEMFKAGARVATADTLLNRDAFQELQPHAIVLADPVLHNGCSKIAAKLRDDLKWAIDHCDPYIVVPQRDYRLYEEFLVPEQRRKLVALPASAIAVPNLSLSKVFLTADGPSLLSQYLLPVACSVGDEVILTGFDEITTDKNEGAARPQGHLDDAARQVLRKAHPAFWEEVDTGDATEINEELNRTLQAAEELGKRISVWT